MFLLLVEDELGLTLLDAEELWLHLASCGGGETAVANLPQQVSPGVPEIDVVPGDKRPNIHAIVSPFLVP
jgi:hypothetical protein